MERRFNKKKQLLRLALLPLFAVGVTHQAVYTYRSVEQQIDGTELAAPPFGLSLQGTLLWITPGALQAGVKRDGEIVSVSGRPLTGHAVLAEEISRKKAGENITFAMRSGGSIQDYTVQLEGRRTRPATPLAWAVTAVILILPAFCLAVGFWVAFVRPQDASAWVLLGLMTGFANIATMTEIRWGWPGWIRPVMVAYQTICQAGWSAWMLLFGLVFPYRFSVERERPWLLRLLAAAVFLPVVGTAAVAVLAADSFAAAASMQTLLGPIAQPFAIVSMVMIGGFFFCIGLKSGTAPSPDARRRLRLLIWGASAGMTPSFCLILYSLARGRPFFQGMGEQILIPAFLMTFLVPATLAYVIVVQRAMDAGVVLRMGVQYAIARVGARAALATAAFLVLFGIMSLVMERQIGRQNKMIILVLSAVSVAVVVRLARKRLFLWIDQRFFREAYQAEHLLSELGDHLRTIVEEKLLLETVARRISETLHVPRIATFLATNGAYLPEFALGYAGVTKVEFPADCVTVRRVRESKEPPKVYFDDEESWIHDAAEGESQALKALDSQLLLPLAARDKLLGFLSLSPKQSEEPYSGIDVKLLRSVAGQTALALENSRLTQQIAREVAQRERLNREIEIAREVQERLFPQSLPAIPGIDYVGHCRPALGVGGDYYDFIPLSDGNFGIAIGDVSGKGIAAALLMASLQASLRGQTIEETDDLARVMRNVNRLVYEATPPNRYATFFYAQYNRHTRRLSYVNAGHNPPMVFRRVDGKIHVLRLETGGPVVGLLRDAPFQQGSLTLERGDVLIGFTDGISEAMNIHDEEWGEERLAPAVEHFADRPAAEMIPSLMAAADQFVDGAPQHDDMTLVVVKVEE